VGEFNAASCQLSYRGATDENDFSFPALHIQSTALRIDTLLRYSIFDLAAAFSIFSGFIKCCIAKVTDAFTSHTNDVRDSICWGKKRIHAGVLFAFIIFRILKHFPWSMIITVMGSLLERRNSCSGGEPPTGEVSNRSLFGCYVLDYGDCGNGGRNDRRCVFC
jgi:hypothetical protein